MRRGALEEGGRDSGEISENISTHLRALHRNDARVHISSRDANNDGHWENDGSQTRRSSPSVYERGVHSPDGLGVADPSLTRCRTAAATRPTRRFASPVRSPATFAIEEARSLFPYRVVGRTSVSLAIADGNRLHILVSSFFLTLAYGRRERVRFSGAS